MLITLAVRVEMVDKNAGCWKPFCPVRLQNFLLKFVFDGELALW